MNIEDCKIGTKVRVISTETTDNYSIYDGSKMLGVGGVSVVNRIEGKIVLLRDGHWYAVKDLQLYEKLPKVAVPEKEIAKLTVSVSDEDKEEIAKDILKIVLKDLNVIISDAIDNLYDGVESNEPQTFFSYYGLSDEALRKIMDEVTEDLMKDCVDLNNTESSSTQTDTNVVTEDSILTNLLNLIEKATADGDLESLLNLTTAYQRMKSASTI